MKEIEIFKNIFNTCKEYTGDNEIIKTIKGKCELAIFQNEIFEMYNINISINKIYNTKYIRISECHGDICLGVYNESNVHNMEEKPNNEMLLSIQFPTGPYIFGRDYDTKIFNEFYEELKTYNPKFCDDINHYLYFDMKNAGKIYNEYENIYKKYKEKYNSKIYKRKIEELKEEINYWENKDKEINC